MKKQIFILIILIILSGFLDNPADSKEIKTNMGISNNRAYIKANINGHKITVKSPKISKNKYLKLVNVAI